jgi:hypothetical protein
MQIIDIFLMQALFFVFVIIIVGLSFYRIFTILPVKNFTNLPVNLNGKLVKKLCFGYFSLKNLQFPDLKHIFSLKLYGI